MRKLMFIAILFITSTSYGQMTKADVTSITNDAFGKSIKKVNVFFSANSQTSISFTAYSENPIETKISENYIEIKESSGKTVYLSFENIKGMLYYPDKKIFQIFMMN